MSIFGTPLYLIRNGLKQICLDSGVQILQNGYINQIIGEQLRISWLLMRSVSMNMVNNTLLLKVTKMSNNDKSGNQCSERVTSTPSSIEMLRNHVKG